MKLWSNATGRRQNKLKKSSKSASQLSTPSSTPDQNIHETVSDLSQPHAPAMHKTHSRSSSMRSQSSHLQSSSRLESPPNISNLSHLSISPSSTSGFSKPSSFSAISNSYNDSNRMETVKQLDTALIKFLSKKNSSASKSNILRTKVLPNLRYPPKPFDHINDLLSTAIVDLNINLLLMEAKCFFSWWTELFNILSLEIQSVPSLDKNCYYETVSRIISHSIWSFFQFNQTYSQAFAETYKLYQKMLLQTFELSILRLNGKTVTFSVSIFIAKVFAYSFFNLPNTSRGLSFLLNTKLKNFKQIFNICIHNSFTTVPSNNISQFSSILNDISTQFPDHLVPMISANVQPRNINYVIESQFINSVYPPKDKIEGIKETKGIWVNRWCSNENVTVFCSFFRNYLTASSIYLKNFPLLMINEYYVFGMPGFLCFLTHIYQIFSTQINQQICKASKLNSKLKNNFSSSNNIPFNDTLFTIPPKVSSETNIDKCFNVLRDLLTNQRNANEKLLHTGVIKGYENILKLFIVKTNILDTCKVEIVLGLFTQFLKTIESKDLVANYSNSIVLDWKFWIDTIVKLLDSNHLNSEIKALSTLYQIWDHIPLDAYDTKGDKKYWITVPTDNIKLNLINHLISDSNWNKFLGHYNPLERHMYVKLIIWKILGLQSSSNISTNYDFKFKALMNQHKIKETVFRKLTQTYEMTKFVTFKPCDPVINKKFQIVKSSDEKHRDQKLRVYPFEVFDDTVYSSSKPKAVSNGSTSTLVNSESSALTKDDTSENATWMGRLFNKSDSKSLGKFLKLSKSSEDTSNTTSNISSKTSSPISSNYSSVSSLDVATCEKADLYISKDFSYPPEWIQSKEQHDLYEFVLVDNHHRIQMRLHRINTIKNLQTRALNDFYLTNDPPRLPEITVPIPSLNSSLESLESEDLLSNEDINALEFETEFDEFDHTKFFDLGLSTGTKMLDQGSNVPAPLVYLSNGLLEFNEETIVFERFFNERLSELKIQNIEFSNALETENTHEYLQNNTSSSSFLEMNTPAKPYRLQNPSYEILHSQIPKIVPDLTGDRPNAF
ncbi:hypothetical protein CANINC_003056 [Pichia inconspicua]|uniref:Uncharacterized protein n=1 Tax=Pichia inconspicua TaxID=52247 RepID=A0A4T0X0V3_9ASCO|nr:hypothetical protein CANINC_003056 [[Candida] inconspicua]